MTNLEDMLENEDKLQGLAGMSKEHIIGVDAFLKKERPDFI